MTGLVMALFLFTNAISSAISEACTPALNDPFLIWPYAATAIAGFLLAAWFYWLYRDLDNDQSDYQKEVSLSEETPGLHALSGEKESKI